MCSVWLIALRQLVSLSPSACFFDAKVVGGVKEIMKGGAKFVDGREEKYDAIILATGYKSNVPSWLKVIKRDPCYSFILFYSFV